jgi:hypothetical protein
MTNARLIPTSYLPTDQQFEEELVKPLAAKVMPLLTRHLGRTADCEDLSTLSVQNCFAAGESAFANFIADGLVEQARENGYNVDLAFVDATCARIGVPVNSELTFGDWFNVMPFADTISLYWLTGKELEQLVKDNAHRSDRPNTPHTERGFIHFSHQLRYTIVLDKERQLAHAEDIRFKGHLLSEQHDRTFLAASSSFVRKPAAAWESYVSQDLSFMQLHGLPQYGTNLFLRNELASYITAHGGITAEAGARRDGRLILTT